MSRSSWKRVLAVPALLSLALGGALLAAAPASAAPGTLVVTSPTDGSEPETRAVEFTGTGSDGAGVAAANADATVIGAAEVVGGAWTLTLTFPADAPSEQTVTVNQILLPDTEPDTATITITLPDPVVTEPSGVIVVDTPVDGATLDSRIVTFTGSAPVGSSLTVAFPAEEATVEVPLGPDGSFELEFPIPFLLGDTVTVTFAGLDADGAALEPVDVTFTVPAPIPAPVIVSPVTGSTVTGPLLRVTGTGEPGVEVQLLIVPADEATLAANGGAVDGGPLLPRFVVPASGQWAYQVEIPAGNYTAVSFHSESVENDLLDQVALSLPSNEVAFSLVAPTAASAPQLAATGPATTGLTGPAALLVLAGVALLVVSRRRQAVTA